MKRLRIRLFAILLAFSVISFTPAVMARGGGGHSSSGGGHSSGGGGGGHYSGGGGMGGSGVGLLLGASNLSRSSSSAGNPLVILIIFALVIYFVFKFYSSQPGSENSSGDAAADLLHRSRGETGDFNDQGTPSLHLILSSDPAFSLPAFFDFAYALFGRFQKTRAGFGKIDLLSGYFSEAARNQYRKVSESLSEVNGVLVSGLQLRSVQETETEFKLIVSFQANYTEVNSENKTQSWYSDELWVFQKKKGVLSKPPAKMHQITCPACGAPPSFTDQGVCGNCGQQITSGNFDWFVESITYSRNQQPPLLTSTVEETGTDLPTLYAPGFMETQTAFLAKHPDFNWPAFYERIKTTYFALQQAWTEEKWELVRPYESENLFQMHLYWIEEYKKQGMRNVLEDIKLTRIEPVKITEDQYYESITARVYGNMIDFTIKEKDGTHVSGNPGGPRFFTEYWTLIRTHQSVTKTKHETGCPACGAPLSINQSGKCTYCQSLVTTGDFDWVLSQIEQDETYRG